MMVFVFFEANVQFATTGLEVSKTDSEKRFAINVKVTEKEKKKRRKRN